MFCIPFMKKQPRINLSTCEGSVLFHALFSSLDITEWWFGNIWRMIRVEWATEFV